MKVKLNNGVEIPAVGFGVFRAESGEQTKNAVKWAIESGYAHIDTATIYKNERSVGEAIKECGVNRNEVFITTKVWNDDVRGRKVREAFEYSLNELQTDYIDLYLIHWPVDGFEEAWSVLEELYLEKKVRAIGVSNFHKQHIEKLMAVAKIKPMINQIESNPKFNNQELINYCCENNITVQVWSPLGGKNTQILDNAILQEIADAHNKSVAQVVVRWHLQRGVIPLPKSINKERIESNIDVYDFELSDLEMKKIMEMEEGQRAGPDPDNFDF